MEAINAITRPVLITTMQDDSWESQLNLDLEEYEFKNKDKILFAMN